MAEETPYPPIGDYGFIGDLHAAALVSRSGSIDWCCMPRLDAGSLFGRILDWDQGGHCGLTPEGEWTSEREYIEGTLVLRTTFRTESGVARVIDCFAIRPDESREARGHLIRIVEGAEGSMELRIRIAPRFDHGGIRPWIRTHDDGVFSAIGGDDGLAIWTDGSLEPSGRHDLEGNLRVDEGDRHRVSLEYRRPEVIEEDPPAAPEPDELDGLVERTIGWWREWSSSKERDRHGPGVARSAEVLKALTYAPTGAIAAAATTSLPEAPGGERNWDYRFSWIRDSTLAARSLAELGDEEEANGFRRFAERSAAGHAEDLQVVYGLGGERRLIEHTIDHLEGYRGSTPVRVGNAAWEQVQLDVYGELLNLAWLWAGRGHEPEPDYWEFLTDLAGTAARRWREPDHGIWETRDDPQHFVHSKAMCWSALDRALRLADRFDLSAPAREWIAARDEIRHAVETDGYDAGRGIFVQAFGSDRLDAALLLLPVAGFLRHDDERMVRTTDAIRGELGVDGLLRRHPGEDEAFLPCSFWLAECLARQGRNDEAREIFERTSATANDLGLFSEMQDPESGELLGNFPQGLTHLSHIAAAVAIEEASAG